MYYNTLDEVVAQINKSYAGVEELAYDSKYGVPTYLHKFNGVGCAIGCLVSEEFAEELQEYCESIDMYSIIQLYRQKHDAATAKLFSHFNLNNITIDDLNSLQSAHDNSRTVEEFLNWINGND